MSKAIKQFFVVAAILAISMVFILEFRPGTNVEVTGNLTCAMEVSGECVPYNDFVATMRLATPPNVEAETLKQWRLRQMMLEGLVERWLLLKDAERLGIGVSEDEVTRQLGNGVARFSLPAAHEETFLFGVGRHMPGQLLPPPEGPGRLMLVHDPKTNEFDYEKYKRWVGRMSKHTLGDFREYQKKELIAARVRALVKSRVRVSEKEAFAKFAREGERAVADYVKLERAYYRDHVIDRGSEAVDDWAGEHQSEIDEAWGSRKEAFLPECRQVRHLLLRIDETNPDAEAAKKAARDKIEEAKKRLDAGEPFATVAREMSEDPRSAPKGGALGCFAAGKLAQPNTAKPVDDAAFALGKGEVSEPVETPHGLHLVTVDAIAKDEEAEKIGRREVTLDLYLREEAERMAAEAAKQILDAVKGGKSLKQAIEAHLAAVLPVDAKAAYDAGKARAGGEGAEGQDGEDDKSDAVDAWSDPTRPQVKTSDPFSQGTPPFSQVQNPSDAAKVLFELDKPGAVAGEPIKLYEGYAVAQLKERKPVDDKTWQEERSGYLEQMRREKGRDALASYVRRLREQYAKEISYKVPLEEADPSEADPGDG
jgi:peptidyl-prolyl cis-trans isomerase D